MKKRMIFSLYLFLLIVFIVYNVCVYAENDMTKFIAGHWEGSVVFDEFHFNTNVDFSMNQSLSATLSMPDEGFMFIPLQNLVYEFPKVSFELEDNNLMDIFEGTIDNDMITGKFTKGSKTGAFILKLISSKPQDSQSYFGQTTWKFPFMKSPTYQEIQHNRDQQIIPLNEEELVSKFKGLLYHYSDFKNEPPTDTLLPPGKPVSDLSVVTISVEDASREIDFLFQLIKYGYGGYQFFGGDEKFLEAKDRIVREISTRAIEGEISLDKYLSIITHHLDFIQDGHFRIGGVGVCKKYGFFTTDQYIFNKDNQGFYTFIDQKKHYLLKVDDQDPSAFIKLSLDQKGKIVYRLGTVSPYKNDHPVLNLIFDGKRCDAVLLKMEKADYIDGPVYDHYEQLGIPVIQNRSLSETQGNVEKLRQFVSEANRFIQSKVVILDLRSNCGGNSNYAAAWCRRMAGNAIQGDFLSEDLVTDTALKLNMNTVENIDDPKIVQEMKASVKVIKSMEDATFPGWGKPYINKSLKVNNHNFIVVIIDSYTVSAAEDFINYLRQMNQVIFIGTNTAGAFIAGNVGTCQLPYSKLSVAFGRSLTLEPDLINRDGIGFFPDIWVNPTHALDYAVQFVKRFLQ